VIHLPPSERDDLAALSALPDRLLLDLVLELVEQSTDGAVRLSTSHARRLVAMATRAREVQP